MNFLDGIIQLAYEAGYDTDNPDVLAQVNQHFAISGDPGNEDIDFWDATYFGMAEPTREQVYAAACRYDERIEAAAAAVDTVKTMVDAHTGLVFLDLPDADKWEIVAAHLYLCGILDEELKVVDPDNW